jgi:hypothetical protein
MNEKNYSLKFLDGIKATPEGTFALTVPKTILNSISAASDDNG